MLVGEPQLVKMGNMLSMEAVDGKGAVMFDRKVAAADGMACNVWEAESRDLAYLVENTCMSCTRLMKKDEIKVVPPRYVQERDHYVRSGAVGRRLMCVVCYNALKTVTKSRARYRDTAVARKGFFAKSIINNILLR